MGDKCMTLKNWVKTEDKGCKPCSLAILTNWYRSEIGDEKVQSSINGEESVEELVGKLDSLKESNPDKADELKQLDCYVQEGNQRLAANQKNIQEE